MSEFSGERPGGLDLAQNPQLIEWLNPEDTAETAIITNPEEVAPPFRDYSEQAPHFLWQRARTQLELLRALEETSDPFSDPIQPPQYSNNYPEVAQALLRRESKTGVSEFLGGPLDLYDKWGIEKAWLTPVEVADTEDSEASSDFHVLYLDCFPWDIPEGTEIILSTANETDLKLNNMDDEEAWQLREVIQSHDGKPKIVIRPSLIGSLYFPKMRTPTELPPLSVLVDRIQNLGEHLGGNLQISKERLESLLLKTDFELWAEAYPFVIGEPREISNEQGTFYAYGVYRPDDPWQFYELFTAKPLEQLNRNQALQMRIDSGCDIGQLYGDRGCDCHPQLLAALGEIKSSNGIIIHAPTQDGRGYGMNTKMETEGGKRGLPGRYNQDEGGDFLGPMDTVQAAELVFQDPDRFDLRTFDGMGQLLKKLGFKRLQVFTDNARKLSGLRKAGLEVERIQTNTLQNADLSPETVRHIKAKHETGMYFDE